MIYLARTDFLQTGIFGNLYNDDRSLYLSTLEHAFPVIPDSASLSTSWAPILQPGQYTCVLGEHQLLHGGPFQAYQITNVPGHSGVLFHIGNYNKDSDGCVLLGMGKLSDKIGDMLTLSDKAFTLFMNFMNGIETFPLTVS